MWWIWLVSLLCLGLVYFWLWAACTLSAHADAHLRDEIEKMK